MDPFLSKTELDIVQIKKADLIRYYDLPGDIRGLLIVYDGKRTINLCEYDHHWSKLTQAADRLYLEDPSVCMDEHTKDILEHRSKHEESDRFSFITKIRRRDEKALGFGNKFLSAGFVGFFLSQIFSDIGADITVTDIKGYRGRYCIFCKTDGEERVLPCVIAKNAGEYRYTVGNISEAIHTASITRRYGFDSTETITETFTGRELRHEYRFDLAEDMLTHRIAAEKQIAYLEERPIQSVKADISDRLQRICCTGGAEFDEYDLPWGEKAFRRRDGSGETIYDNGNGLIVQVIRDDRSGVVTAVHEVFERSGRMLIQTELISTRSAESFYSAKEGFYYRYMDEDRSEEINEELLGVPASQILERYIYR